MRDKAKELLKDIKLLNYTYGGKWSDDLIEKESVELIISFAREIAEEQKKECAQEVEIMEEENYSFRKGKYYETIVDKDSILNAKNVAE